MTDQKMIDSLCALGMSDEGKTQFKVLHSFLEKSRNGQFDEKEWAEVKKNCFGLGLYWLKEARKKGWTNL